MLIEFFGDGTTAKFSLPLIWSTVIFFKLGGCHLPYSGALPITVLLLVFNDTFISAFIFL